MGALIVLYFCPLYRGLYITAAKTGKTVFCAEMAEGEEFVLSFIHSLNKGPVFDTLRVEGDHLLFVRSRFDCFDAGMSETSTDNMKLQFDEDGWFVYTMNRPVPEFTFFVGWVANHSLHIKGQDLAFVDLAEPGTLLSLRIEKASCYELWKGRYLWRDKGKPKVFHATEVKPEGTEEEIAQISLKKA